MKIARLFTFLLLNCFLATFLLAQGPNASIADKSNTTKEQSIFQKLGDYQEMTLTTNLDSLQFYKKEGRAQRAKLVMNGEGQTPYEISLKIEARGKYRRRICDFPPIKLNFSKKELEKSGFARKYDKLKLVTHCMDDKESLQTLFKEYWTYKLYNEITPASFQVHLIKINYVNEDQSKGKIETFAILIEDNDELANRLGGEIVEGMGKTPTDFTSESYVNTVLFNYMIGNTDWNIQFQKNIKMIKTKTDPQLILVPYDFDFSAFVKASYARLNPDYPEQKKLEDRIAQGKFSDAKQLHELASKFLEKEQKGFDQYQQCLNLSKSEKKRIERFLASFFDLLRDQKELDSIFLAKAEK